MRIYCNLWSGKLMWYAESGQHYGQGPTKEQAIASLKIRLAQTARR